MSSAKRIVTSSPVYSNLRLRSSKTYLSSKTKFSRARYRVLRAGKASILPVLAPRGRCTVSGEVCLLLAGLKPLVPRLKKIWADGAFSGKELAKWCEEQGGWEVEIVDPHKTDSEITLSSRSRLALSIPVPARPP